MAEKVSVSEAHSLRSAFLKKFTSKSLPQYRSVMGHGDFYGTNGHNGLLWEIIRPYKIILTKIALELISQKREIFVMWDKPLKETNRELQKTRMLKTVGADFVKCLKTPRMERKEFDFLIYDYYVFDREMSFHITFTREYLRGFGHICLTSITDLENDGVSPAFRALFEHFGFGEL